MRYNGRFYLLSFNFLRKIFNEYPLLAENAPQVPELAQPVCPKLIRCGDTHRLRCSELYGSIGTPIKHGFIFTRDRDTIHIVITFEVTLKKV